MYRLSQSSLYVFRGIWVYNFCWFSEQRKYQRTHHKRKLTEKYVAKSKGSITWTYCWQSSQTLFASWYFQYNEKNVKVTLLHGCFSHFLNCKNGTKSSNASKLWILMYICHVKYAIVKKVHGNKTLISTDKF